MEYKEMGTVRTGIIEILVKNHGKKPRGFLKLP